MNCQEIDYELLIEEVKKLIRNGENNVYYIVNNIFNKEANVENFTIVQMLVSLDDEIKAAESKSFEYSKIEDLKIPWWKFWVDRCKEVNDINKLKFICAKRLAYMKRSQPPYPPLMYKRG